MTENSSTSLTINNFQAETQISIETLARLEKYKDILTQWQKKVNLVSQKSLNDLWRRHMLDSAQLFPYVQSVKLPIYDLGSGAGFPGLVLAIMGIKNIHLVESDNRKCTFLREVNALTNAGVTIHNIRIEKLGAVTPGLVISRGLSGLDSLLEYADPILSKNGFCLFLKGQKTEQELTVAYKNWMMRAEQFKSLTDPTGVILKIDNVSRKNDCESRP
jgi:16S rRNA (guanine527-N7)-methyltransferase